jgi:hypothetical protein
MARILECPASVEVCKLYPNEESEASNLGTIAHGILEDLLVFGVEPQHDDLDLIDGVNLAADFANQLGEIGYDLHIEKRLSLADTPVWGTADIVGVAKDALHIADFKFGYLPVDVYKNVQLITYLSGSIEEFGERDLYEITVIQPRYHHSIGPIRTYTVHDNDLQWFRDKLAWAMGNTDKFSAGKHCKYCPARGGCKAFAAYAYSIAGKALYYDLTDAHGVSDKTLAALLDFTDLLPGWRDAVRKEAFKRILADRKIEGYKVVPGAKTRDWVMDSPSQLEALYADLGLPEDAIYEAKLISPATAEKHIKSAFKGKKQYEPKLTKLNGLVGEKKGGLVVVKNSDGRMQYRKGMEFEELPDAGEIEL